MRHFLPHLLWLSGILLVIIGAIVGPGEPADDLTPEMRVRLAKQLIISDIGVVLFVIGIIWVITRWLVWRSRRNIA